MKYTNSNETVTFIKKFNKAVGSALVEHYQFQRANGTKFELPIGEVKRDWEIVIPLPKPQ